MTALRFDMNNPGNTDEDSFLTIVDDINSTRDALYALELAASGLDRRARNAFATTLYAISATLDEIGERIERVKKAHHSVPSQAPVDRAKPVPVPSADTSEDAFKALEALIHERHRLYHTQISAYSPFPEDSSNEAMEPIIDGYEAAHMAWLQAPVFDARSIRLKARYALSEPSVLEGLRENEGELEALFGSIAGGRT